MHLTGTRLGLHPYVDSAGARTVVGPKVTSWSPVDPGSLEPGGVGQCVSERWMRMEPPAWKGG